MEIAGKALKEAREGVRWMPWRQEPRKDVAGLRKAPGSCQASFDPGMSEWGNLGRVMPPRREATLVGQWGN